MGVGVEVAATLDIVEAVVDLRAVGARGDVAVKGVVVVAAAVVAVIVVVATVAVVSAIVSATVAVIVVAVVAAAVVAVAIHRYGHSEPIIWQYFSGTDTNTDT